MYMADQSPLLIVKHMLIVVLNALVCRMRCSCDWSRARDAALAKILFWIYSKNNFSRCPLGEIMEEVEGLDGVGRCMFGKSKRAWRHEDVIERLWTGLDLSARDEKHVIRYVEFCMLSFSMLRLIPY